MKTTTYQKTHRPIKAVEHKCSGKADVNGECGLCGRFLRRNGKHLPNQHGYFGFTLHFADGSTLESNTSEV